MTPEIERSEKVIEDYKKHKIARSALRRIQQLLHGFEQERVADRRMARIGVVLILLILAFAAFQFFGGESIRLS